MIQDDLAKREEKRPLIRVNHRDPGMSFQLITGRTPIREQDGSFLVTEEELAPLRQVQGFYVVGAQGA